MLEKFDCLVIMNYRNHALGNNGIVENAQVMLREASTLKKKIVVAVETVKSTEGPRVSFYSISNKVMERSFSPPIINWRTTQAMPALPFTISKAGRT